MILMGNLTFLFCFSIVSFSKSPIASLISVIYCRLLLGTTINSCFQRILILLWIIIYVGGIMIVFTYCVFFSNIKIKRGERRVNPLVTFLLCLIISLSSKETWFFLGKNDKTNDNFVFSNSFSTLENFSEKTIFMLGENGALIVFFSFILITTTLFFTILLIREMKRKQNLF